jgi:glycosyltransferase involved in cell wall biosynthesis
VIAPVPFDVISGSEVQRAGVDISVVTPVFNPGPDLEVTAASLRGQTFRNFEWILVDDASAERHADAIEGAAEMAGVPTTVLRHRQNARQGQARNTGLTLAGAPYVKFLDANDALDSAHLETLLAETRQRCDNRVVLFAPTRHIFLRSGRSFENHSYRDLAPDAEAQLARQLVAPFVHHCGALFTRDLIQEIGGYDPTLATDEDGDLLLRILLKGWRFEAEPTVFYDYRHHEEAARVSRDDTIEKIRARRSVGERVAAHFAVSSRPIPAPVRDALCRRFDALAVRHWRRYPAEARSLVSAARALDPSYARSGSAIERGLRCVAGIGAALLFVSTLRRLKGVKFH